MELPRTIPEALDRAREGAITLLGGRGDDRELAPATLLARARQVAAGLRAAGLAPGDRVLLVLPTGEPFLAAFFGASWAGLIPCQLSPPEGFGAGDAFARRVRALAEAVGARALVATERVAPRAEAALAGLEPPCRVSTPDALAGLGEGAAPVEPPGDPDAPAFIQFTSGTTHLPKGVVVPHRALAANVAQIAAGAAMVPGSRVVSWLPMFHDMGLVSLLTCLFHDLPCALGTPLWFLRRPAAWLEAIARLRATHSPAPTFAYRHVADRLKPGDARDLDLSCWRVAWVGAEPVQAGALRAFERLLAPRGLAPTTLLPCYGMAEATLAVSFAAVDEPFRALTVSRRALREEGRARPAEAPDADALELVSCGRPLAGTRVRAVGPDGEERDEGEVGELLVLGPSLFGGYWGEPARATGAEHRTGDLGFLEGGEVFVTGRVKDLIIVRGHNLHPEEVEWAAGQVRGVRAGRAAALGVTDPALGTERVCLVAEVDRRAAPDPAALETALRRHVHEESGVALDDVLLVEAGALPTTTSGKLQRGLARRLFEERTGARS